MTKTKKVTKRRKGQSASKARLEKARLERNSARYVFLRSRIEGGSCIGIWKETENGEVIEGGWVFGRDADRFIDVAMRSNAELKGAANEP